jgi:hypothetical protein
VNITCDVAGSPLLLPCLIHPENDYPISPPNVGSPVHFPYTMAARTAPQDARNFYLPVDDSAVHTFAAPHPRPSADTAAVQPRQCRAAGRGATLLERRRRRMCRASSSPSTARATPRLPPRCSPGQPPSTHEATVRPPARSASTSSGPESPPAPPSHQPLAPCRSGASAPLAPRSRRAAGRERTRSRQ